MKTPEELWLAFIKDAHGVLTLAAGTELIRLAQKEALEEAVKCCTKHAKSLEMNGHHLAAAVARDSRDRIRSL